MSPEKLWRPAGRISDVFGAWQAVAAVGGTAGSTLLAVSVWAFSTLKGVMDQGWGAVFLAGLGAVIAAALALAAVFFGLAAFAVGFRRIWPLPAQAGRASKASGAPEVRDAQQPAAVAAAAPVYTWPAMETAYEDQSRENRVAVELRAKIADVETVAKTRIDQGYSLFKRHYEELGARQGALERELGRLRNEIERRFRVRDAARVLMELRAELEPLGERLLIAERTEFPNAEAWQVAYRKWHEQTKNFWLVAT